VSFCVLFVCKCVLYHCQRMVTQLQITNISYNIFIIYWYIISYTITDGHIISCHHLGAIFFIYDRLLTHYSTYDHLRTHIFVHDHLLPHHVIYILCP
jgi:hypothetical protein